MESKDHLVIPIRLMTRPRFLYTSLQESLPTK